MIAAYNQAATLINSTPASQWLFAYEAMGFPEMTWTEIQLPHYRQAQPPIAADVERVYHWMRDRGADHGNLWLLRYSRQLLVRLTKGKSAALTSARGPALF